MVFNFIDDSAAHVIRPARNCILQDNRSFMRLCRLNDPCEINTLAQIIVRKRVLRPFGIIPLINTRICPSRRLLTSVLRLLPKEHPALIRRHPLLHPKARRRRLPLLPKLWLLLLLLKLHLITSAVELLLLLLLLVRSCEDHAAWGD